jgi:general stress protein 26
MNSKAPDIHDEIQKVADLIQGIRVCMMTTVNEENGFHSRPMLVLGFDQGWFYFFSRYQDGKIEAIHKDQHVNLAYADPNRNRFVSIAGRADIIRDAYISRKYWSELARAWFPHGPDDPDLVLIRVKADTAEYWDSPSGKVVQVFGAVKSLLTGKPLKGKPGDHDRVKIAG